MGHTLMQAILLVPRPSSPDEGLQQRYRLARYHEGRRRLISRTHPIALFPVYEACPILAYKTLTGIDTASIGIKTSPKRVICASAYATACIPCVRSRTICPAERVTRDTERCRIRARHCATRVRV